jgi:hypothetical protein
LNSNSHRFLVKKKKKTKQKQMNEQSNSTQKKKRTNEVLPDSWRETLLQARVQEAALLSLVAWPKVLQLLMLLGWAEVEEEARVEAEELLRAGEFPEEAVAFQERDMALEVLELAEEFQGLFQGFPAVGAKFLVVEVLALVEGELEYPLKEEEEVVVVVALPLAWVVQAWVEQEDGQEVEVEEEQPISLMNKKKKNIQ